ncbi:DUF6056 family protein [Embleya sp. NPDC005575]|uniref:DUF6056 family protein n=1 Tax=Embleya sp. NPDC005575 TaxID=3156892 RepID=UPI0033BA29D3
MLIRAGALTGAAVAGILLSVGAFLGVFVRPSSDDWCVLWKARDMGTWGLMDDFWNTQNGRVSNAFVSGLVYGDGLAGVKVLPLLLLVFLALGLFLLYRTLWARLGWEAPASVYLLLSLISTCAVFLSMPIPYQALLWAPATISHTLPFVIGVWSLFWCLTATTPRRRQVALIGIGVVGLFIGMLSEPFTVVSLAMCGVAGLLALPAAIRRKERFALLWNVSALVGLVVGLGLLYTSPGAKLRRAATGTHESALDPKVLKSGYHEWLKVLDAITSTWTYLAVVAVGVLLGLVTRRLAADGPLFPGPTWLKAAVLVLPAPMFLVITFGVTLSLRLGYGPGGWSYSRTWLNFLGPTVVVLGLWGVCLGVALRALAARRGNAGRVGLAVIAVAAGVFSAVSLVEWTQIMRDLTTSTVTRAQQWDAEDARTRAQVRGGATVVTYDPHRIGGLAEAFMVPRGKDWAAGCVARYYQVDEVVRPRK